MKEGRGRVALFRFRPYISGVYPDGFDSVEDISAPIGDRLSRLRFTGFVTAGRTMGGCLIELNFISGLLFC